MEVQVKGPMAQNFRGHRLVAVVIKQVQHFVDTLSD